MYPLSNVLGNSLNDSYGEGYHYEVMEGSFPRVTSLVCNSAGGGGGNIGDTITVDSQERVVAATMHLGYSNDISDHYTSQSQTSEDFPIDQHHQTNLEEFAPSSAPVLIWDCTTCGVGKMEEGSQCTTSGCEGCRRPIKRRNTANKKERRRTQSINNAFTELRDCIPNVPSDTKLSKIKTLRLATSYIAYLSDTLAGDDPLRTPAAFTADLSRRMTRGSGGGGENKRKELIEVGEITSHHHHRSNMRMDRRGKGRTGWPQHCWAMELQK